MLSLQDRNWLAFSVDEIFTVSRPPSRTKDDYEDGDVPFIASGASGNGVAKFCKPKKGEQLEAPGCISVSPVDGSCFYQPISFLGRGGGGSSIMLLRSDVLNSFTGVFIARMLTQTLGAKYTYGRMGNSKTILREQLLLPVNMLGEPDWKFMEDYIREREAAQAERCREFLMKRIADIERERVTDADNCLTPLAEKIWRSYRLSSIGVIQSGRDIYASDRKAGDTPYITSGSQNNGIGYFVANINDTFDSGYIALNRNGAVGMAFYHPYPSLMGNDCRKLHVKAADGNPYVGNFIALAISKQSECFSYSRKLGTARAQALRIMLPAADDGQPDYAYMEDYGRNITLGLLKKQLAYITEQENLQPDSNAQNFITSVGVNGNTATPNLNMN